MTEVFERYPRGGGEKLLALALADHAHDDGAHIFPGILRLAHKSAQSERTVQRQIQIMLDDCWLILVREGGHGPKDTNEYAINPDWIAGKKFEELKGDKLSPLDKGDKTTTHTELRVTKSEVKGDTAMSPEPSITIIKSNQPAHGQAREALAKRNVPVGLADKWLELRKRKSQPIPDEAMLDTLQAEAWLVGLRVEQALEVCVAQGWAWFKAKWYQDLPDEKKLSNAHGPPMASAGGDWRSTPDSVLKRGRELGIEPRVGESERDYRDRVGKADWDARRGKAAEVLEQVKAELSMQPA